MKIATYNVNSIRRRLPLVLDWLERHRPDVMCLQETKVVDPDFPVDAFKSAGYHATFRGMKAYNGVATLTLRPPDNVVYGFGDGGDGGDPDAARLIQTVVDGIPIINTYVPQGYLIDSEKYAFKLAWFGRLGLYFKQHLDAGKPAIWLGDVNVAPHPIDVYHPDRRVNDVDFHIDARNAYHATVAWGFVDVFRKLHPERIQYTYWDFFRKAFERNFGWRIDLILATAPLANRCTQADVDMGVRQAEGASDHTVMWADFAP